MVLASVKVFLEHMMQKSPEMLIKAVYKAVVFKVFGATLKSSFELNI